MTAVLANDRGTFSTVSAIDVEKVEILEVTLDRLSGDHPDRALVLAGLCSELTIGSPLGRRDPWPTRLRSPKRSGDDAVVVRVLNHIQIPLAVPHLPATVPDSIG